MVVRRGDIWWADLPEPSGSEPGRRRPVLVVQADPYNQSRLRTVIAVGLTTNLRLADAPGNVLLEAHRSGLSRDSVANVTQLLTLDRDDLLERGGRIGADLMDLVDRGLRRVLAL